MTTEDIRNYLRGTLQRLDRLAGHLRRSLITVEDPALRDPLERLDRCEALTARFARFQDLLSAPFKSIARLEFEETATQRIPDLLNLMAKRGILDSTVEWTKMRELRNAIAHEYWEDEQQRDELFAAVCSYSRALLEIFERMKRYIRDNGLV